MQLGVDAVLLQTATMIAAELRLELAIDSALAACGLLAASLFGEDRQRRLLLVPIVAVAVGLAAAMAWHLALVALPRLQLMLGVGGRAATGATWCFIAGVVIGCWQPRQRDPSRHVRGARIRRGRPRWRSHRAGGRLRLAGADVPTADETKHFKLIGTTGTGKTTAIQALLRGALDRGDPAVIADPDGTYQQDLGRPGRGDVALNPLDATACRWDLFGEIGCASDADSLARALLPDGGTEDRSWRLYARVFVASLLRQLIAAGERDVATLHRLVTSAATEELRELLDGTAAAAYVSNDNARFFASVRAIASSDLAVLEPLALQHSGRAVSVREWVRRARHPSGSAVLFLPYRAGQIAALRGLIGAWLRLAIFETMCLAEDPRPLWFVVDELDALGPIDGLKDALARLRKYGGRCVLGMQSISQLSGTYGAAAAQTIVENCGNSLLLRCSAGENGGTARFASMLIGDREIVRTQTSRTHPAAFGGSGRSRSETSQHHVERAVLPAEIEQLPDRHGYLKLASWPDWQAVIVTR